MIEIVWEVIVKEEARGLFELAYGPGGKWSKLFAGSQGFRGTSLLRDTENPRRYLVIDVWDSLAQRDRVLEEQQAAVADLEAAFAGWTESRAQLGVFQMRADAAVRPHTGARRGTSAEAGRRGRRPAR